MVYSGAWGKLIHEKNQKQKISWHFPFKAWFFCILPKKINACIPKIQQLDFLNPS